MNVRRLAVVAALLCLAAAGPRADGGTPRPNVVLIVLDTVRADHLSCYGYARRTSPRLDRLARRSVLFENASSQSNCTPFSFASLFTSRYPGALGGFMADEPPPLREENILLAEVFQKNGYRTAGFAAGRYLAPFFGFHRGFDRYEDIYERARSIRDTGEEALRWLSSHRQEPFFLFIHGNDAHSPYLPPLPYRHRFAAERQASVDVLLQDRSRGIGKTLKRLLSRPPAPGDAYEVAVDAVRKNPRELDHLRAHYDGAVFLGDEWIGRLLDRLAAWGLADRTIVVVTSDHGEELGERGRFGHGEQLYQSLTHVPLLIHDPRARSGGRRVPSPVEHIDVAPTLLALLGVTPPGSFQGRSLVPLMEGDASSPAEERCVYGASLEEGGAWRWSVRCGEWKLLCFQPGAGSEFTLYNLRDDPGESADVLSAHPDVALRLSGRLTAHLSFLNSAPPDGAAKKAMPPELRRALEEAGYLVTKEETPDGPSEAGGRASSPAPEPGFR